MKDEESVSRQEEKEYEHDIDDESRLDASQLQQTLRTLCILIPSDEIASLYSRLSKYYRSDQNHGESLDSFSITQLYHYVEQTTRSNFAFRLVKILCLDIDLWFKSLFVWAGVILIINSLATETIPIQIRTYMSMVVAACYFIDTGRDAMEYFFREWRERAHNEICIVRFKEALWKKCIEYRQVKVLPQTEIIQQKEHNHYLLDSGSKVMHYQPTKTQLITYIKEQLYDDTTNPNAILTKGDLELLLLKELGSLYTSRLLSDVMSAIDKDKSGTISPTEFHHFLATTTSDNIHQGGDTRTFSLSRPKHLLLQRFCAVVWVTITEPNWINTAYFVIACILDFMNNFARLYDDEDLSFLSFGTIRVPVGLIVMLLFIMGCSGFIRSEYEILRDEFDLKERAKDIMVFHVRYSDHYKSKSERWEKYSHDDEIDYDDDDNGGLDKMSFVRLLEESNVHMSEVKLDMLFHDMIDANGDGNGTLRVLSKDDIESYLTKNDKERNKENNNKQLYILKCFMRSWSFWGNFMWIVGCFLFILSIFLPPNGMEMAVMLAFVMGAFTFWIGGICLCGVIVKERAASLTSMVQLKYALATMVDTILMQQQFDEKKLRLLQTRSIHGHQQKYL